MQQNCYTDIFNIQTFEIPFQLYTISLEIVNFIKGSLAKRQTQKLIIIIPAEKLFSLLLK